VVSSSHFSFGLSKVRQFPRVAVCESFAGVEEAEVSEVA